MQVYLLPAKRNSKYFKDKSYKANRWAKIGKRSRYLISLLWGRLLSAIIRKPGLSKKKPGISFVLLLRSRNLKWTLQCSYFC